MSAGLDLRRPPRRFSTGRRAFFSAVQRASVALGGRRLYRAMNLRPGRFRLRFEEVAVGPRHEGLVGLRIVQLSDLHAGPFLGSGDLRDVVAACNALQPDAVVVTGDLLTDEPEEALELLDDFSRLSARGGVYGVFGNHDYRRRQERVLAAEFERHAGVRFLLDEHVLLERDGQSLALIGLEDLEEAKTLDYGRACEGLEPDAPRVVLCHNPGAAEALAGEAVLAVLSGHTHGHQIDLPFVRRLAPPHPGDRRQFGPTAAITSRGLGALGLPLRVRSPAELVVLDLIAREGSQRAR